MKVRLYIDFGDHGVVVDARAERLPDGMYRVTYEKSGKHFTMTESQLREERRKAQEIDKLIQKRLASGAHLSRQWPATDSKDGVKVHFEDKGMIESESKSASPPSSKMIHGKKIGVEKTTELLENLLRASIQWESPERTIDPATFSVSSSIDEITAKQERRGTRGEEEVKRRLVSPGGWEGFSLLEDKRESGCGYDFMCIKDQKRVMLEVKTFAREGRVVMTSLELEMAAVGQDAYFLVGLLDDGEDEKSWRSRIICNPIYRLLSRGQLEPKMHVMAADLFDIS